MYCGESILSIIQFNHNLSSATVAPHHDWWSVRVHDAGPGTIYLGGVHITPTGVPEFKPVALERNSTYEGLSFAEAWPRKKITEIE